jgi:hypothetical protein
MPSVGIKWQIRDGRGLIEESVGEGLQKRVIESWPTRAGSRLSWGWIWRLKSGSAAAASPACVADLTPEICSAGLTGGRKG